MSIHDHKIINALRVMTDDSKLRTIAITCRCSNRWTEKIPGELHDSSMIAVFECVKCHTEYWLRDKVLIRAPGQSELKEQNLNQGDINDRSKQTYDA